MRRTSSMVYNYTEEARELELFVENTNTIITPVIEMLRKHYRRGVYDPDKAVDAYYMATCQGSKEYDKLFGYSFSVQDRFTAAVNLEENLRYLVQEG